MKSLYNQIIRGGNWLAPPRCIVCKEAMYGTKQVCCDSCYLELPFQGNYCRQCGQAYGGASEHCGRCIESPPAYDACFCPFEYAAPVDQLICGLKYRERPELAKIAAQLLLREIKENEVPLPDVLVPVPIHISRLRNRGFNQSKLIAEALSRELKIPLASGAVVKSKATKPQAEQSLAQRKKSLAGSFALKKSVRAQSVAIIDDVVTTGSTVTEIAKILKKNGVDYVQVWGIAHTM